MQTYTYWTTPFSIRNNLQFEAFFVEWLWTRVTQQKITTILAQLAVPYMIRLQYTTTTNDKNSVSSMSEYQQQVTSAKQKLCKQWFIAQMSKTHSVHCTRFTQLSKQSYKLLSEFLIKIITPYTKATDNHNGTVSLESNTFISFFKNTI